MESASKKKNTEMGQFLRFMRDNNATDLHLTVGLNPYVRIDGRIMKTDLPVLTQERCREALFGILTEKQRSQFEENKVLDCSYGEDKLGRFRINIYQQRGTIAAAIRWLPQNVPSLDELGLPVGTVKKLCELPQGLILVAGPVGSGKTTTLAAMVRYINTTRSCHIISVEDPIEYIHRNEKSLIHQRELNIDTLSFADALKYGLREDPDVILVGEMRDLETISSAVTLAETGHLILATLHTSDAGEAISRIVDVFPGDQQSQIRIQLSSSLEAVINQMLIPESSGNGRVLATEVMIANPAIRSLIRENRIENIYSHIQMGAKYGMRTLNRDLLDLVRRGRITAEEAMSRTSRPKELEKLLAEAL